MRLTSPDRIISSQPVFPNEIFQLIVDEIAHTDDEFQKATLRSLTLVSRDFVPICQPHLFRQITFGRLGSKGAARQRLQHVLITKPLLSRYVERVNYTVEESTNTDASTYKLMPGMTPAQEEEDDRSIFNTFANLKTLSILSSRSATQNPNCIAAVHRILRANTVLENLTTLTITRVDNLAMIIVFAIPNLLHLTLSDCECTCLGQPPELYLNEPVDAISNLRLKLTTLVLGGVSVFPHRFFQYMENLISLRVTSSRFGNQIPNFFDESYGGGNFRILQTLYIDNTPLWVPVLERAKSYHLRAFPTVTHLALVLWDDLLQPEIDACNALFEHFQYLETLKFFGDAFLGEIRLFKCMTKCNWSLKHLEFVWHRECYEESLIQVLCDGLSAILRHNVLQTISCECSVDGTFRGLDGVDRKNHSFFQWRRLNALLTKNRTSDFPHLKRVSITMDAFCPEEEVAGDWIHTDFLRVPLKDLLEEKGPEFDVVYNLEHNYRMD
ncbi:hypothetical protein BJ165DRAFT_1525000 [Panaeolus papilionaceus]|nr:hypothetical protein BJ165DRAFT_1525000 [Panaeolus papilionaceus]